MGKAGTVAVPTGPFTATGHRSRVLSLEALVQQSGKAIRVAGGSWVGARPEGGTAGRGWSEKLSRRTEAQTFPLKSRKRVQSHTERHTTDTQTHPKVTHTQQRQLQIYIYRHTHRHKFKSQMCYTINHSNIHKSHKCVHFTQRTHALRHTNMLKDTHTDTPKVIHTHQSQM